MGNVTAKEPGMWNSTEEPDFTKERWVSELLDDRSLANVSIPGTHQSMANAGLVWSWCQSLPIKSQLKMGIRFFDIHCRHLNDQLPVYHANVFQNASLCDVLKPLVEFLDVHSFEVIVIKIKEEVLPKGEDDIESTFNLNVFSKAIHDEIKKFPDERFYIKSDIPTLGQARGKIVLVRDFGSKELELGIPYENVNVSDDWNIEIGEKKYEVVKKHLQEAFGGSEDTMFLTFTNSKGGLSSPSEIARVVNAKCHSFLLGRQGRFGIIAMDYPGPELVKEIIDSNF